MNKTRSQRLVALLKGLVRGIIILNVVLALAFSLLVLSGIGSRTWAATPTLEEDAAATGQLDGTVALAAALVTGLATLGAGAAVAMVGSAALGTIAERPESFGRALIFVGLAEGIAIYGLIVSFLILSN